MIRNTVFPHSHLKIKGTKEVLPLKYITKSTPNKYLSEEIRKDSSYSTK